MIVKSGEKKNTDIFGEQYEVNLDYQKSDGYWVHSHNELVEVMIKHGSDEKQNHGAAAQIIKDRYFKLKYKCRINKVTYL